MKTRFPKKLQGFLSVACITLMSGCGTFLSDRVGGFSGIEEDVRIVKEPFYWSLTLGLIPMAAIVSMPVDLAVDIVLYPFDVWLKIVCGSKIHLALWVIRPRCTALI